MRSFESPFRFQMRELADNPVRAFGPAIELWQDLKGNAIAPSWKAFNLMDLPLSLIPNCIVVDIRQPLEASTFRFFGTAMVYLHGQEMSGKTAGEIDPPQLRDHVLSQYRIVCDKRRPMVFVTRFSGPSGMALNDIMLRMPLSDDGARVSQLISFGSRGNEDQRVRDIYAEMSDPERHS